MRRLLTTAAVCLTITGANAVAGYSGYANYKFEGGSSYERTQVRQALAASSFNWNLIPGPVTVHIGKNSGNSDASPGNVWLAASLLDAGSFSWGVVQHEFAHEVDFGLLTDQTRQTLAKTLGGEAWWCYAVACRHSDNTGERFASTLAWAYWPSPDNVMAPDGTGETSRMRPATFRRMLNRLLAMQQSPR